MLLELINLKKLRKAVVYAGIALLTIIVQNLFLADIRILGVAPMVIPVVVVAIGFFEGGVWGGVFGIIVGLVCDMTLNGAPVMMAVLFPILGFFSGALTIFYISRHLFPFFCMSTAAITITAICQAFEYIAFADTDILNVLLGIALQTVLSLPFVFAVYYPCRAVSRVDLSK